MGLGIALGLLVPLLVIYFFTYLETVNISINEVNVDSPVGATFGVGLGLFAASGMLFLLKLDDKKSRQSYFMLPASSLEKYLARMFASVTIIFLAFSAAVLVVNALFYLLVGMKEGFSAATCPLFMMGHKMHRIIPGVLVFVLMPHSFCVLGGVVFRKKPYVFVFTIISAIVVLFALVRLVNMYSDYLADNDICLWIDRDVYYTVLNVGSVFISGIFYYLSYRIFKRIQVTGNTFFNL